MTFEFDDYRLDPVRRELQRHGERVHVEPRVFDLILYLLQNRERVVCQDELLDALWNGRLVSESTFRSCISAARRALSDSGRQQHFIRTLPRRGIRFVAPVSEGASDNPDSFGRRADAAAAGMQPEDHGRRPTVAVLPFGNISGKPEWEHYADGIAEDVMTALAKHRSLFVVARNSTFMFRQHVGDLRQVGRDLGADYVVEGSLQEIAQHFRIAVHLVEAETGRLLWADRYDSEFQQVFDVQDDITAKIVSSIEPQIGIEERARAVRRHPETFRAWDLFHLGAKHLYSATPDDNRKAQRLLRQAVEHDPGLAQAYALLSYAITLSMLYFDAEPAEDRQKEALDLARRGLDLDDQDALTRFVYGRALLARGDYSGALEELQSAVETNPALAVAYCGVGDSLAYEGRFDEALPYFQRAIDLSPHDPQRWAFYAYRALAHLFAGEFDHALDWAKRSIRVPNCLYWPYSHRICALGHLQRHDELRTAIDDLMERRPGFTCTLARKRLFYVKNPRHLELYLEGLRKAGMPD